MDDILNKKEKFVLGIVGLASIGLLLGKVYLDVNNYKVLNKLNKKLLKYSWEYYD